MCARSCVCLCFQHPRDSQIINSFHLYKQMHIHSYRCISNTLLCTNEMLPLKFTHRFPKGTLLLSLFGIWLRKPGCYHLYRLIPGQLSSCYEWMPWLAKGSGAEEGQGGESRTEKYSSKVLNNGSLGSSRAMSPSGCMLNTDTQGRHTNIQKTLQLCTCTQSHTVSEGDSVLACQRHSGKERRAGAVGNTRERAAALHPLLSVRPPPPLLPYWPLFAFHSHLFPLCTPSLCLYFEYLFLSLHSHPSLPPPSLPQFSLTPASLLSSFSLSDFC